MEKTDTLSEKTDVPARGKPRGCSTGALLVTALLCLALASGAGAAVYFLAFAAEDSSNDSFAPNLKVSFEKLSLSGNGLSGSRRRLDGTVAAYGQRDNVALNE